MPLNSPDTKTAIRRRMFLAAVRKGNRAPQHGFQLCPMCRGQGSVCIERNEGGAHTAAFEECPRCKGETIVPTP